MSFRYFLFREKKDIIGKKKMGNFNLTPKSNKMNSSILNHLFQKNG